MQTLRTVHGRRDRYTGSIFGKHSRISFFNGRKQPLKKNTTDRNGEQAETHLIHFQPKHMQQLVNGLLRQNEDFSTPQHPGDKDDRPQSVGGPANYVGLLLRMWLGGALPVLERCHRQV